MLLSSPQQRELAFLAWGHMVWCCCFFIYFKSLPCHMSSALSSRKQDLVWHLKDVSVSACEVFGGSWVLIGQDGNDVSQMLFLAMPSLGGLCSSTLGMEFLHLGGPQCKAYGLWASCTQRHGSWYITWLVYACSEFWWHAFFCFVFFFLVH